MSTPYITERKNILSHCCNATIMEDSDICMDCKDHCQGDEVCDVCDGTGKVEEIDESRLFGRPVINVPYKKVTCEKCLGEGFIVVEIEI